MDIDFSEGGWYLIHVDRDTLSVYVSWTLSNDVIGMDEEAENVVNFYRYTPFGDALVREEQVYNPYQYTGRQYDAESGLYHYRARAYSADIGRFMQQDPAGMVDGANMYAYVGNNPVNGVDPTGMSWWCKVKAGIVAAVIALIMYGIGYLLGTTAMGPQAGAVVGAIFSGLTLPIAWSAEYSICKKWSSKSAACNIMVYAFSFFCVVLVPWPWALNLCYAIMVGISVVVCPYL